MTQLADKGHNLLILAAVILSFSVFVQASEAGRDCQKVYRKAMRVYNEAVALADSQAREEYADALERVSGRMDLAKVDRDLCYAAASERYAADLKASGGNKAVNEAITRREEANAACGSAFTATIESAQQGYKTSITNSQAAFEASVAEARTEYDVAVQNCK